MMLDVDYFSAQQGADREPELVAVRAQPRLDGEPRRRSASSAGARSRQRSARGPAWQFVGLEVDWDSLERLYAERRARRRSCRNAAWRASVPSIRGGEQAGYATSGCWSPLLKKYLALAHLRAPHVAARAPSSRSRSRSSIGASAPRRAWSKLPFFDPERKKRMTHATLRRDHRRRRPQRPGLRGVSRARRQAGRSCSSGATAVGGAAVTEEMFPGFKFSVFSYVVSLLRPEIIRDLELPRHGLQILPLESTRHAARQRRLPRAVGRPRPEPPRARAPFAARRRGVRRVRPADAPHGARR